MTLRPVAFKVKFYGPVFAETFNNVTYTLFPTWGVNTQSTVLFVAVLQAYLKYVAKASTVVAGPPSITGVSAAGITIAFSPGINT